MLLVDPSIGGGADRRVGRGRAAGRDVDPSVRTHRLGDPRRGHGLPALAGQRPRLAGHRGARQRPGVRGRAALRRLDLLAGAPPRPRAARRLVVDLDGLPALGRRVGLVRRLPGGHRPGRADPVPGRPGVRRLRPARRDRRAALPAVQRQPLVPVALRARQPGHRRLPAAHQRGVGPRPDPERDGPDLHPRRRPGLPAGRRGGLLDRALALRGAAGHPPDGLDPAQPRPAGAVGDRQRVRREQLPRPVHARWGARRRLATPRSRWSDSRAPPRPSYGGGRTWSRPGRRPGSPGSSARPSRSASRSPPASRTPSALRPAPVLVAARPGRRLRRRCASSSWSPTRSPWPATCRRRSTVAPPSSSTASSGGRTSCRTSRTS